MKKIYIGFSAHRLEAIPFYKKAFEQADFIILEDFPNPLFNLMLSGKISLKEYIENIETTFPKFLKAQCKLLQEAYKNGKVIIQIDPYMEKLVKMYQLIENGKSPEEIKQLPEFLDIYEAEHEATGRLLDYYQAVMENFEKAVKAVKEFAHADAKRIALRDRLRAEAIAHYLKDKKGKIFIEAGYIHIFLSRFLQNVNLKDWEIKASFLLAPIACSLAKKILGKPLPYPLVPGDILTFWYMRKKKIDPQKENLLAARVLIYNKLISSEELEPTPTIPFPHLKQEFFIKVILQKLSYKDCAYLYEIIKFLPQQKVWQLIQKVTGINYL